MYTIVHSDVGATQNGAKAIIGYGDLRINGYRAAELS